jgi:hypothetical protein
MNTESELQKRVDDLSREVLILRRVVFIGFALLAVLVTFLFWPLAPALLLCAALAGFVGLVAYPFYAALQAGLSGAAASTKGTHEG